MSFFASLAAFFSKIIFWCLGFLIAVFILFVSTFYVVPVTTGLPLDTHKYISQTVERIEGQGNYTHAGDTEDKTTLSENIISEIDKAADNLIKWINQ